MNDSGSLTLHLRFKRDRHLARQSGRHRSRRVEINGDEILQVIGHSQQLAVVDSVRDIGQLEPLTVDLPHIKILKNHLLGLTQEGFTLWRRLQYDMYPEANSLRGYN